MLQINTRAICFHFLLFSVCLLPKPIHFLSVVVKEEALKSNQLLPEYSERRTEGQLCEGCVSPVPSSSAGNSFYHFPFSSPDPSGHKML